MADALLAIKIVTDYASGAAGLDQASARTQKFAGRMQKLALPAAAVVAGIAAFGKAAVDAASRAEQAMGGVDAVFGRNAGKVKQWAAGAATSLGLARSEYGELATLIGSQLKNAGMPLDQTTEKTKTLIETGADLAAMYGGTTKEAVEALSSALKGETDPIEKYGATITAAQVSAEMAAHGWDKLSGKAAQTAKAQATLNLITKQTAIAHGAAAREADSAASKQQQLAATFENMQATLGAVLLPTVVAFAKVLSSMANFAAKNATAVQVLVGVLGALAVAVLVVNAALKVYQATLVVVGAVQKATFLSNPIFLVIAALVLLGVAIYALWKKSQTFRKIVTGVWNAVKVGAKVAANLIKAYFSLLWKALSIYVKVYYTVFKFVFNGIRTVVGAVVSYVRSRWSSVFSALRGMASGFRAFFSGVWSAIHGAVDKVAQAIRSGVSGAIDAVKRTASGLASILSGPWNAMKSAVDKVAGAIQGVINVVSNLISKIAGIHFPSPPKWLSKVPGFRSVSAPAPARFSTVPVAGVGAPRVAPRASSGGVTINVSGAMDPEAVARQINRILAGHNRRVGLST